MQHRIYENVPLRQNHAVWSTVMNRSQSGSEIGLEFRSEQSYQILEEGNRIGLGFNLCIVPTRMICRYVLQFQDSHWRLESDRGRTGA